MCALKKSIKNFNLPVVVKADGLAAGKGVYICESLNHATKAVKEVFDGKFGRFHNYFCRI